MFSKTYTNCWHKPVYLTDKISMYTLYRKLRVSSKKGINKICKGNVFFYKYLNIIIRLQMKKKVFFCILKQIMYSKIYTFLILFLRRNLRAGEVEGQIQPTSLS